jgi:hypothetical protein
MFTDEEKEKVLREWAVMKEKEKKALCKMSKTSKLLEWIMKRQQYPTLRRLSLIALLIPSSTAWVERGFSIMKVIKTERRNGLGEEMLSALIVVKMVLPKDMKEEEWEILRGRAINVWASDKRVGVKAEDKSLEGIEDVLKRRQNRREIRARREEAKKEKAQSEKEKTEGEERSHKETEKEKEDDDDLPEEEPASDGEGEESDYRDDREGENVIGDETSAEGVSYKGKKKRKRSVSAEREEEVKKPVVGVKKTKYKESEEEIVVKSIHTNKEMGEGGNGRVRRTIKIKIPFDVSF